MITEKQIEIAMELIGTKLVNKVFHSVELVESEKGKFPAYKIGAEEYYVGPDDTRGRFAYIRQSGSAQTVREDAVGSCSRMYKLRVPMRIIIFKDREEKNHEAITNKFLRIAFLKDVSLVAYSTNAFALAKQESSIGDYAFDARTFYLAIDIYVKFQLLQNDCDEDLCLTHSNPICS